MRINRKETFGPKEMGECLKPEARENEDDASEEQEDVDDAEPLLVLGRALQEHAQSSPGGLRSPKGHLGSISDDSTTEEGKYYDCNCKPNLRTAKVKPDACRHIGISRIIVHSMETLRVILLPTARCFTNQ